MPLPVFIGSVTVKLWRRRYIVVIKEKIYYFYLDYIRIKPVIYRVFEKAIIFSAKIID